MLTRHPSTGRPLRDLAELVLPEAMESTREEETYDANGVDRSLVRWFLLLTPYQRLAELEEMQKLAELAESSRGPAR